MKRMGSLFVVCALGLSGCAHSLMRGSVAMKVNDQEGYVCMGDNEVKVGDKVAFYKNECTQSSSVRSSSPYAALCTKVKLGDGQVTRLINEHYSVVKANPNVTLTEGTVVEK